ncbi:perlucin-like protein [Amphiura filiformis]|uniref:perlucin-like protein n=1 Tax=Amphiura filiformis TaxID=82378 RepID=UPI003B21F206
MECPRPEWKQRRETNTCYWFEDGDRLPQYKADERCRRYDGKLVKIDDAEECDWINGNVIPDLSSQIGGGNGRSFYMGLKRDGADQWRWELDNTIISWPGNWDAGEPNNHRNKENCVIIYESTGKWNDVMCGDSFHYVCEYQIPPQ